MRIGLLYLREGGDKFMMQITHIFFSIAISMWVLPTCNLTMRAILSILTSIGSIVPDLDLRFKHRKALHNVFVPLILCALVLLMLSEIPGVNVYVSAFLLGWLSHILLDVLTLKGVYLFYPLLNHGFKIGVCRSGSLSCNLLFSFISLTLIMLKMVP